MGTNARLMGKMATALHDDFIICRKQHFSVAFIKMVITKRKNALVN
jgi:hypothetical protein